MHVMVCAMCIVHSDKVQYMEKRIYVTYLRQPAGIAFFNSVFVGTWMTSMKYIHVSYVKYRWKRVNNPVSYETFAKKERSVHKDT
jgi:hypothetical protein